MPHFRLCRSGLGVSEPCLEFYARTSALSSQPKDCDFRGRAWRILKRPRLGLAHVFYADRLESAIDEVFKIDGGRLSIAS
jgi:hypothetical protein